MTHPPSGARCLVVDDSHTVRHIARRILEQQGCHVEEAADGLEALAACRASMPRCILLDWVMPVMNGVEFLAALRAEFRHDLPAVVFCTARAHDAALRDALRDGARGCIAKPYDTAAMVAALAGLGVL